MAWDGSFPGESRIRKKCVFLPGSEILHWSAWNMHDARVLSHMWNSPLLVAISLGSPNRGSKMLFWTICLWRSFGALHHKQLPADAWPCHSFLLIVSFHMGQAAKAVCLAGWSTGSGFNLVWFGSIFQVPLCSSWCYIYRQKRLCFTFQWPEPGLNGLVD